MASSILDIMPANIMASRLYDALRNEKLCLIYNGSFNDELTHRITDLTEFNVAQIDEINHLRKKMSFLVVECFQNIVRHGDLEGIGPRGTFWSKYDGQSSMVSSMNLIPTTQIDQLRSALDTINNLSKEELRDLSREILESPLGLKGNAGLGLVEMARRSGEAIAFDFDTEEDLSKFFLSICLGGGGEGKRTIDQTSKRLINELFPSQIQLVYKGDFNPDTIEAITEIARQNAPSGTRGHRLLGVLIELTYNMHLHGVYNANYGGLLVINREDQGLRITTANYCMPGSSQLISNLIDELNANNREDRLTMLAQVIGDQGQITSTGLIKVANMASDGISYAIEPFGRTHFLTMSVVV